MGEFEKLFVILANSNSTKNRRVIVEVLARHLTRRAYATPLAMELDLAAAFFIDYFDFYNVIMQKEGCCA